MVKVIENAVVIGRSFGERVMYVIGDEATGGSVSVMGNSDIEMLELGAEGLLRYDTANVHLMLSFEPVMQEVLA